MTPTREQLQSIARAVAAHASAVTKAGLPHDSEHGIGEYAAILAACLAAPLPATPEPQAMPPIETGDWILWQWFPEPTIIRDAYAANMIATSGYGIHEIRKADGTVWTREPRR